MWPSLLEERGSLGSCLAAGTQPSPRPPQPLTQPHRWAASPHLGYGSSHGTGASRGTMSCPHPSVGVHWEQFPAQAQLPGAGHTWDLPVTSPCARAGGDNPS